MFSKETEYAMRSLVYIRKQNIYEKNPGVVEIAREIEAPPFYTGKILQNLVRRGLLASKKGKGGGFYFPEGKSNLLLKDLIEVTEGNHIFTSCGFGQKSCDCDNPCPLHEKYSKIRESLNKLVSTETIDSLTGKAPQKI